MKLRTGPSSRISTPGEPSGYGIHSKFAVTDTFYRPATSFADATLLGIYNGSHTTPVHGLCLDAVNGGQTTSGTVIDGKAEGVAGTGWWLASASSMTFESGTSENNSGSGPGGIQVDHLSKYNTFTSTDLEGNSNEDALDNGSGTKFVNVIAGSSGGIQVGPSATFSQVDSPGTTPSYASGSEFSWGLQGSEIISKHVANASWSGASVGFNALGDNEADWYTDSQATSCAHAWFGWNGSSSASLGCLTPGGQMNTPHGYEVGGTAGFSGAVAISGCMLTYSGGILTGKSGTC